MDEASLKFITDAINAHGIFFKKAVRRKLEEFRVIKILDEEHPTSFPDQTAIDLLLEYPNRSGYPKSVIVTECKKAYAPYKKWIFFPDHTVRIKGAYFVDTSHYKHVMINPGLYGINVYSDGIEVDMSNLRKKDDTSFKSGNCDTIYRAASQVCKGFLGFLHARDIQLDNWNKDKNSEKFLSFPLIITNATLYGCDNDYDNVNLETGNLESKLQLGEIPWLLFRHPHANITSGDFRDFRTQEDKCITPEEDGFLYKEPVFILNSKHLKRFFTNCPIFNITPS